MILKILRYTKGYVTIQIEGYSPERFLNICRNQGIVIWNLRSVGCAYELCVSVNDFRKIRPFARKTNTHIRLKKKDGFPFLLFQYKKRKLFFFGILLAVCLFKIYSLHIWDIHIEGNQQLTDMDLTRFLKMKNVHPLMKKTEVDCEKIEQQIRKYYDNVVWVSAALDGARISISIKENEDVVQDNAQETETAQQAPTDIVAAESGKITKMITRKGTPLVHPGDEVKKGEVLVQGNVAINNDENEVTGYQYEHADADISADITLPYKNQMSTVYYKKKYLKNKRKIIPYVTISEWTISMGKVDDTLTDTELYRMEQQIKIGENFYLPIRFGYYEIKPYTNITKQYSKMECQSILSADFKLFCKELKKKGIQIRENSVKIHWYGNRASANGEIYVNQSIVQTQDAQKLDIERNTQNESSGTDG